MDQVLKIVKKRASRRRVHRLSESPPSTSASGDGGSQERLPLPSNDEGHRRLSLRKKSVKRTSSQNSVSSVLEAVRNGRMEEVSAFLKDTKGLFSKRDRKVTDDLGWGLVHIATETQRLDVLKMIIASGMDPNQLAKEANVTPLAIAVCSGFVEMTEFLLNIKSVREAYSNYLVNFILLNPTDDSVFEGMLNVRLSVQRKVHRHGQQFCKPMLMWEAAVLVGRALKAAGRPDPYRIAYLLQSTRCPGLAILPAAIDHLNMRHMQAEYLQLLLTYPEANVGLTKLNICSVLKDLLWWQIHSYANDLKPCVTAASVKSTVLILFSIKAANPEVTLDLTDLVQQFMHPVSEDEILCNARADEREVYLKRMVGFKMWMLRTIRENTSEKLHRISFDTGHDHGHSVKLSVSAVGLDLGRQQPQQQQHDTAGSNGKGPAHLCGGLYHCIARCAPIEQVSSLCFWKELFSILGDTKETIDGDPVCCDLTQDLGKRRVAFGRSQSRGMYTFEESDKIAEGLKAVEAYVQSLREKFLSSSQLTVDGIAEEEPAAECPQ